MSLGEEALIDRLLVALARVGTALQDKKRELRDGEQGSIIESGLDIKSYSDGNKLVLECFVDLLDGKPPVAWWIDVTRHGESGWLIERRLLGHDASGDEIVLQSLPEIEFRSSAALARRMEALVSEALALTVPA